ncbi:MAG: hypothetical protein FJX77_01455 [Armatimonadetes bacterium]|nr:hypothetical protein [Armatimonadota bacterium]
MPICSIRRYGKGHRDPVLDGREFAFVDIVAQTWRLGSSSRNAAGESLLEYQDGIAIVCRPTLVYKDTRTTHYTTSGGTWEEARPGVGPARVYRLRQISTAADLAWAATSIYWLPPNPEVAVSLQILATPIDHDSVTYPPYVRLEFGGRPAQWAAEWSDIYGGRLLQWVAGAWRAVRDLPDLGQEQSSLESLVLLRCLRGRIGISTDRGRSYAWWGDDETPISVASGPLTVRGTGHALGFGLQQLFMAAGVWTPPARATFTSVVFASPVLTSRHSAGGGSSVVLADASAPLLGQAAYTATLTPGSSTGVGMPWAVYKSPELYAVTFRYPVHRILGSGAGWYDTPWDGEVYSVDIRKPYELAESSADLDIMLDPDAAFDWDSGRWPAVQVHVGWTYPAGGSITWPVYTGYAETVSASTEVHRDGHLRLRLHNPAIRFREAEYSELDRYPYGGFTVNQALDLILNSEGLQASDRVWHIIGDYITLPLGAPEEPAWWPARGDAKWDWMVSIAESVGLELGVLDDGRFVTVPAGYVEPVVGAQWEAAPASDLGAAVLEVEQTLDSRESATCVLVYGEDAAGRALMAFAVDTGAETSPFSPRFSPWRRTVQEQARGTSTLGRLVGQAQALARRWFGNKYDTTLRVPLTPTLARRMQATITGESGVGITSWHRWAVLSIDSHLEHDPSFAVRSRTDVGLRRLN